MRKLTRFFTAALVATPFRLTTVMHLEQGRWKIIQLHFSIGVPNSDLPI